LVNEELKEGVLKIGTPSGLPVAHRVEKMGFLFLMATNRQLGTKAHALCASEEAEGSLLIAEAPE